MSLAGRLINNRIRVHDGKVFMSEEADDRPCKCCATECAAELTIEVSFCGMTVTEPILIPGILTYPYGIATLPDGSYLIVSAEISCTACGWEVLIGVCGYCDSTGAAASDSFTAFVPFAATAEQPPNLYCPEAGAVDLVCFGQQFGIPCVVTPTATIA